MTNHLDSTSPQVTTARSYIGTEVLNFTIDETNPYHCPVLQAAEDLTRQELDAIEPFFNSLAQTVQDEIQSIYVVLRDPGLLYASHRDGLYTQEAVAFIRSILQEQILHCVNERRQSPQVFHATLSAEERAQQQRLTELRLNPPSNAVNVEPNYSSLIQRYLEWAATREGQAYYFAEDQVEIAAAEQREAFITGASISLNYQRLSLNFLSELGSTHSEALLGGLEWLGIGNSQTRTNVAMFIALGCAAAGVFRTNSCFN